MFRTEMRALVRGNELIRTFKHIIHDYRGYIKAVLFINTEFSGSGQKLDYDGNQNSRIKSYGRLLNCRKDKKRDACVGHNFSVLSP